MHLKHQRRKLCKKKYSVINSCNCLSSVRYVPKRWRRFIQFSSKKTVTVRFAVVLWARKEVNVKKSGNIVFRTELKAQSNKSKTTKKATVSPIEENPAKRKDLAVTSNVSSVDKGNKRRQDDQNNHAVTALKDELRERKLKSRGKKCALVTRLEEYEDLKERDTTRVQLTQNDLAPSPTLMSTLQDQSLIGFAGRTVVLPSP